VGEPLPPRPVRDVELADLHAFLAHPVRAFLRQRLDVSAPLEAEETLDAIPLTLDGLEKWQIGDRMLAALLEQPDPPAVVRSEQLRGTLPPGPLGGYALDEIVGRLKGIYQETAALREGDPRAVDVDVDLGDGRRLTGTVPSVHGGRIVHVSYSSLAAKHRLRGWLDLLALSASDPDTSWTAHTLGRGRAGTAHAIAGPLDHRAIEWLRQVVDLYDRGMREPLPLPVKTACAYAEALRSGSTDDALFKARREWETDRFSPHGIPGEDADIAHVQVFGAHAPFDMLTGSPREDEDWNTEPTRLGRLARRLWAPLLDGGERVGHL